MRTLNRLKIITAYDHKFREIGAVSEKSIRIYAAIHGVNCSAYHEIPPDRPPAWAKIKYLIDEICSGASEFILWIDADACFVRGDEDILSYARADKDIYVVNHKVRVGRIPNWPGSFLYRERPNTGVMLVRASDWSLRLLQRIWEKSEYLTHPWWEQAAFHDIIGYFNEISLNTRENEPDPEIMAKIQWLPMQWNSIPTLIDGEPGVVAQNPVIVHFAGMPDVERRGEINKLSFNAIALGANIHPA